MCGICGYISSSALPDGTGTVRKMTDTLAHRGPDNRQQQGNGFVRMGFARLAIIDLSERANQPMPDDPDNPRFYITVNGEIFNYLELKDELTQAGHSFRTSSDSEVALRAYIQWGEDCFHRFRGMWALCIWDLENGRVIFSRDQFGIKPLYFYETGSTVYWASEIKAFGSAGLRLEENPASSHDYIKYGLIDHGKNTFFNNITQLCPGEMMVIDRTLKSSRNRYWSLEQDVPADDIPSSSPGQVEMCRSILLDTAKISLRSDVPVWVLLSGGVDSSATVSMVHHLYPEREINTVSVVHKDPEINEYEYVKAVQEKTGCSVVPVKIRTGGWIDELDRLVYHQDEPVYSTTAINHWFLMKELRNRDIKVVLSGQGVDEMLYGYVDVFMSYYFYDLIHSGRFIRLAREIRAHWKRREYLAPHARNRFALWLLKSLLPLSIAKRGRALFIERSSQMIKEEYSRAYSYSPPRIAEMDELHNAMYRMLTRESIPRILHYEDRNSMAHSIEERVPFLDPRLASLLFSLPADAKVRNGVSKWIFRESLRGILPDAVRKRKSKMAFSTPEASWMRSGKFIDFARDRKLTETLESSIINTTAFNSRIRQFADGNTGYSPVFWRVYNYALWKQRFKI